MDVRFNYLQLAEQEYVFSFLHVANLTTLESDAHLHAQEVTSEGGGRSLPTPAQLFPQPRASDVAESPTLLPTPTDRATTASSTPATCSDSAICPHCRSPTCDTLQAEFARHAIEPELPSGCFSDPALEHGFEGASRVEAVADIKAFVDGYAECPDFRLAYSALKGLEEGKSHETYPQYEIDKSKLLLFHDDQARVCVPTSQRQLILKVMHDLPLGMHQATQKLHSLMASRFYWPGMFLHIKRYVESCEHCQRNKPYVRGGRGAPHPSAIPFRRFDCVALDMLSGFVTTKQGHDAIVVFTDRLTKRVYIEPCTKTATARDLALIFFRTVFRNQGMPRVLLSDNGPQFVSAFWKEFFQLLQTDIRLTSSYHPQSNGQTERFNRTLVEALRSFVNARHDNWDEFLTHFEFAYNSTINASTGLSPFILQFAQAPRAPWDSVLDKGGGEKSKMSGSDHALAFGFDTLSNLKHARDNLHAAAQRQRVKNALFSPPPAYAVGDEVLLSTENIPLRGASKKLSPKYIGPFKITELCGKNAVRILPTGRFSAIRDVINIAYLRPYNERSENIGPPPHHLSIKPIAVEPAGEWYTIAEILHHRGKPGLGQKCLVRWEGFDSSHDSWIARKDITPKALKAYESFLVACVHNATRGAATQSAHDYLHQFIGKNGEYSVLGKKQSAPARASKASRGEREDELGSNDHAAAASASMTAADSAPASGKRVRRQVQRFQ